MARRRENMTPLEVEARSYPFRRMLKETLGCKCGNCGSEEMVEYHHVVPLALGGTNSITNIVPLCYKCHKAAHHGRHITSFADHSRSNDGRPPKCDDETAFKALDLLADGQIGLRKCKSLMGLSGRTQPNNTSQYARWCADRGIASVRNALDLKITNSVWNAVDGAEIGCVTYADGTTQAIRFCDTGMNDDVVYSIRSDAWFNGEMTWEAIKARRLNSRYFRRIHPMVI